MRKLERLPTLEDRIRDELMEWIKQHQFDEKGRLPSETELADEMGVSRATIRGAISLLAAQGILIKKHGSGTYINPAMLRLRLLVSEQWEFQEQITSSGYSPSIRYIDSEITKAGSEEAAALGIKRSEKVLKIRKLFLADNLPAIYSINLLSLKLVTPPHDLEKIKGPIFPYLEEVYGITPTYSATDLFPAIAGAELSTLLQVPEMTPLLLFKDTFFSEDNTPILYAHNYFTDLLHFKAIRQPYGNFM